MGNSYKNIQGDCLTQSRSKNCLEAVKYIPTQFPDTHPHIQTYTPTQIHTAPVPEKLQAGSFPISTQKGQSSHQHFLRPPETMQLFKLGQGLSQFRGKFQGSQEIAAILPGDRGVLSRAKPCSLPKYFHSHSCLGGHSQTVLRAMRRTLWGLLLLFN